MTLFLALVDDEELSDFLVKTYIETGVKNIHVIPLNDKE